VRLAMSPVVTQLDRLLLNSVPGLGAAFTDPAAAKPRRIEAARLLAHVLSALNRQPAQEDVVPALAVLSSWPAPGLPVSVALTGIAHKGHLQGPLPSPRLLVLYALRPQVHKLCSDPAGDPELRGDSLGDRSGHGIVQHLSSLGLDGRRPPQRQERLEDAALVPVLEEAAHQSRADVVGTFVEQGGQLVQRVLGTGQCRRAEQAFLVAKEVIDHRDIDAGVRSDRADGGAVVPVAHETPPCDVDDALPALLAGSPPTGTPSL